VDRQCLHHHLRRVHSDGRRARRSNRRQKSVHCRLCDLRARFACLCHGASALGPDCRALVPGRRRRGFGAEFTDSSQPCLPKRVGAQLGGRHLGRRRKLLPDRRAAGRRRSHCAGRLAEHFSDQSADRSRRDVADLALCQGIAVLALGCLAASTIEGGQRGWTDLLVVGGFATFAVLTALFLAIEFRSKAPMLPLSLFRAPAFSSTSLAGLLVNIGAYGLIFVFSLYFQRLNHLSPFWTGMAFVPMMAAILVTNLLAARITRRIGARLTIAIGLAIMAASCVGLLWTEIGSSYAALVTQLIALGAGVGLLVPPLTSTLLGSVAKQYSGVASGVLNAMRQTGSVLGVALFGSLLGGSSGFLPGARIALLISAGLAICALAAVVIGVPRKAN
jgi:hypothetical protein